MKKKHIKDNQRYSILTQDMVHCMICGTSYSICLHEVFEGRNRQNSKDYGLVIPLCAKHHNMSDYSVHFNKELDNHFKILAQEKFEEVYDEDFLSIFKRNYL